MKTLPVTFLFVLLSGITRSQDVITLLSGREIKAQSVTVNEYDVRYCLAATGRAKRIDSYKVFSVKSASGEEQVIYRKDPEDSLEFTPEQMRFFIK